MKSSLIGLVGAIGSGKDTVAQFLIDHHGFKKISFAGGVKDIASVAFGWDRDMMEGTTPESREWREKVDPTWGITPRLAMQKIGTEMFRDQIREDFWIHRVRRAIENSKEPVVITDCRFPNEHEFVRSLGGVIWYVQNEKAESTMGTHASDQSMYALTAKAEVIIDNNGTLQELGFKINGLFFR